MSKQITDKHRKKQSKLSEEKLQEIVKYFKENYYKRLIAMFMEK